MKFELLIFADNSSTYKRVSWFIVFGSSGSYLKVDLQPVSNFQASEVLTEKGRSEVNFYSFAKRHSLLRNKISTLSALTGRLSLRTWCFSVNGC